MIEAHSHRDNTTVASAFIVKFGRQLLQKYSCERATATIRTVRAVAVNDIDGTVIAHFKYVPRKDRLYCIVLLTFLSGCLENRASTSVLAFSARKFTVFLFVVADAL